MARPSIPDDTDTTTEGLKFDDSDRLFLLIVGEGVSKTQQLPQDGEAVIGRSPETDVQIDDPSVSRKHAQISFGDTITITDLGSANGTFVGDTRLNAHQAAAIKINEVLRFGTVTAIIQQRPNQQRRRTRQVRPHDYFSPRLDEECARARRNGGTFAVVHLLVSPENEASAHLLLASHLRDADVIGLYAPGELELLLVDATPTTSTAVMRRISASFEERKVEVRVGISHHPVDGRDANVLIATARERARGPVDSSAKRSNSSVVVADQRMRSLHELVARVAAADISVLLLGETGVGKEVVAETIHRLSARSQRPFMRLNCAALTETLLESELFGHERGAFTGATATKPGLLEVADGGAVFLDEVGELQMSTQVKLLRVLDERKVLRVGAVKPRPIDVRIISATNRDLEVEVHRGTFRLDLFYRLNAMSIMIPPLRERVGEIEPLARHFVETLSMAAGRIPPRVTPDVIAALERYDWPGNVRELKNMIERSLVLCNGVELQLKDLSLDRSEPSFFVASTTRRHSRMAVTVPPPMDGHSPGGDEVDRIVQALSACGGNQTHAAKILGVSRRTLITWIEKHGLQRPRKR